MRFEQLKSAIIILSALFVVALLTGSAASQGNGKLGIYFLDVGQGDAIFIETPSGVQILVDGGPDSSILGELGQVMPFYDRSIDAIFLTHPDADHINGLIKVLERYDVGAIIETGVACATAPCKKWEEEKNKENALNIFAYLGYNFKTEEDGVVLETLYPFEDYNGKDLGKINNSSLVIKLTYGTHSVLLTGDIEKQIEERLVLSGLDVDSDFLKIAHHGSKTSTVENFLRQITPLVAFIQVGVKNRYGHPTPEVIGRLENFGIPYYRTDINGRIKLLLNKEDYKIIWEKEK